MDKREEIVRELKHVSEPLLDEVMDFVRFVKFKHADKVESALLSETSLAKDWLSPDEEEAWRDL
ncbi:MAG: hypothetical protein U5L04_09940 [Trueperaceae bacterium]|nr:hypothetical protein [Trueperaceae bacterium]